MTGSWLLSRCFVHLEFNLQVTLKRLRLATLPLHPAVFDPFKSEQEAIYECQFKEGDDILDPKLHVYGLAQDYPSWSRCRWPLFRNSLIGFRNANSERFRKLSRVSCLIEHNCFIYMEVYHFRSRKLFTRCPGRVACPSWASEVKMKTEKETSANNSRTVYIRFWLLVWLEMHFFLQCKHHIPGLFLQKLLVNVVLVFCCWK